MDEPKRAALPPAAYANFLRITHNQSEFFLAFGQLAQDEPGALLVSSLVTTPAHAKSMLRTLSEAVQLYQQRFGEIPGVEPPARPAAEPGGGRPGPGARAPRRGRSSEAGTPDQDVGSR